ncbi:hypothetical protein CDD81_5629 [Ophiocordyceps australis]|uniref:RNA helicase n=1 Tax=Ophiocordyceps australis TaxID=1399860 RepID=A0A2C5XIA7_9HYPO|nr:hypothetical protein CDD81_5629 [Ophiocordyceps australis]
MKILTQAAAWRAAATTVCQRCLSTTPQLQRKNTKNSPPKKSMSRVGSRHKPLPFKTSLGAKSKPQYSKVRDAVVKKLKRPNRTFGAPKTDELLSRYVAKEMPSVAKTLTPHMLEHVGLDVQDIEKSFQEFSKSLINDDNSLIKSSPAYKRIRQANTPREITNELAYHFQCAAYKDVISKHTHQAQGTLVDLRYPHEWFPATRSVARTIHCHVGPTNSGKTYRALQALQGSTRGVYAGPLRLLAAEVYNRMIAKGRACALYTGEEIRIPKDTDQYLTSCTVEMIPLNTRFDVAVIDEIQLIENDQRGNAWTTALLGVQATEVHVCGENRTLPIIKALCRSMGDKCIVHNYERLSPLETVPYTIKTLSELEKGDAIIGFSRITLHQLKRQIEMHTGRRCAIIYGSLPPEVRAQQAALFNDPDNEYDFLVGSDAIGMGLNLEIQRVIFDKVVKYNGVKLAPLTVPEIKQIGGRAGRFRTARSDINAVDSPGDHGSKEKIGFVTTRDKHDLKLIHEAFKTTAPLITKAVIEPPAGLIENVAALYPRGTPLQYILTAIYKAAKTSELYDLHVTRDTMDIAGLLEQIPLTIHDRLTFTRLPANLPENKHGDLLSIPEIPLSTLDMSPDEESGKMEYLEQLETLHIALNQSLVEEKLISTLEDLDYTQSYSHPKKKSKGWKDGGEHNDLSWLFRGGAVSFAPETDVEGDALGKEDELKAACTLQQG